jgi:hypothetical protein
VAAEFGVSEVTDSLATDFDVAQIYDMLCLDVYNRQSNPFRNVGKSGQLHPLSMAINDSTGCPC